MRSSPVGRHQHAYVQSVNGRLRKHPFQKKARVAGVGADLKKRPRASATITKYGALVLERSCCHICLHAREAGTRYETRAEPTDCELSHTSHMMGIVQHTFPVLTSAMERKAKRLKRTKCEPRGYDKWRHKFGAHFVEKLQLRGERAVYESATTCARMWMSVLRHQVPTPPPPRAHGQTSSRGIHRPAHTLVRPVWTCH